MSRWVMRSTPRSMQTLVVVAGVWLAGVGCSAPIGGRPISAQSQTSVPGTPTDFYRISLRIGADGNTVTTALRNESPLKSQISHESDNYPPYGLFLVDDSGSATAVGEVSVARARVAGEQSAPFYPELNSAELLVTASYDSETGELVEGGSHNLELPL